MRIIRKLLICVFVACLGAASHAQSSTDDAIIVYGSAPSMPESTSRPQPQPIAKPSSEPAAPPDNVASSTPSIASDKIWPRNTIPLFLPSCTGFRPQFIQPCTCIITKLMLTMTHDEFLKKSADGSLEQDARLIAIRTQCVTTPQRKS